MPFARRLNRSVTDLPSAGVTLKDSVCNAHRRYTSSIGSVLTKRHQPDCVVAKLGARETGLNRQPHPRHRWQRKVLIAIATRS